MNRYFFLIKVVAVTFLVAVSAVPVNADSMSSASYCITTTVVSGGGAFTDSTGFKLNATLGQSSPLNNPADPPVSASYKLSSGFWYAYCGQRDSERPKAMPWIPLLLIGD